MELEEIDPDRCFLEQGVICAGLVTVEGCGARCTSHNMPCRGNHVSGRYCRYRLPVQYGGGCPLSGGGVMSKKIVIDPISRIEGEGKVSIFIGTDGEVVKARFQMMEFRAFEEFVKGRMIWDMPVITSKICGICPIPHHLAAVKAVEAVLGVNELPPAALLLRKLLLAGGAIQDHALHFLYLAFPDFVFGPETPPEKRSVAGLLEKHGALVKKAVFLRKCGVQLAEMISSHSIYPVTAIPGGMSKGIGCGGVGQGKGDACQGLVNSGRMC